MNEEGGKWVVTLKTSTRDEKMDFYWLSTVRTLDFLVLDWLMICDGNANAICLSWLGVRSSNALASIQLRYVDTPFLSQAAATRWCPLCWPS